MERLWLVRAGKHGEREQRALEESCLLPGFLEIGDPLPYRTLEQMITHVQHCLADASINRARNIAAQLRQFVHTIQPDDWVVLPRKQTNGVAVGRIRGPYTYAAADPAKHRRPVEWLQLAVPRDTFAQDLRFSLGAYMTVCQIQRNHALQRVKEIAQSGTDPGALLGQVGRLVGDPQQGPSDQQDGEQEEYTPDFEELANQQLAALIKSEFAGHALAELVAEILRVEGFTTRVSPPGSDGGVDILAAGGALGLGAESICVQVKSGDAPANHDVVLRLLGAVSNTGAQTGLLVSISGVNQTAQRELDNNFLKLRLWNMGDLLAALYRTYPKLSDSTRERLPLKQIWAPVVQESE